MKLVIASDIHGSGEAAARLIERYREENGEKLILLGDILYHGPRNPFPEGYGPQKVVEILNPLTPEIICVRGNCDSEVDEMVLTFPLLSGYTALYDGKRELFFTHGHIYNENHLPPVKAGGALIHGHTHIKVAEKRAGYFLLNPGSTSLPKDGFEGSYMVYEDGVFTIKTLNGTSMKTLRMG